MKQALIKIFTLLLLATLTSCGSVVYTSRPSTPPPPWFYPNRVETVRYVYFPEYLIYYDLSLQHYLYLENGVWITATILPPRFSAINFHRTRMVRVRNYNGDTISSYHRNLNRGRSNQEVRNSRTPSNRKTRRSKPTTRRSG